MPNLTIRLFGTPEILLDGDPVAFDTRKAIALLAYLAVTRRTLQRSTIAAYFWPESDDGRARSALRRTLSVINKMLGKQWLEATRTTLGLAGDLPDGALTIDVQEFVATLKRVEQTCSGTASPDQPQFDDTCLRLLQQAAERYRGDFLHGFALHDSTWFDEWQLFQTEQLRQQMGHTLAKLAQAYRERGDYTAAITETRRWLALDELSEEAQRLLMTLYTLAGQRSAALKQYELCVRVLDEQLGVPPQPETVALFEQINGGELRSTAKPPAAAAAEPTRYQLPQILSSFVGRGRELAEIGRLLTQENCRLLTLTGVGGVGKTRLALAAGRQLSEQFENGACFVQLEAVESAELLLPTIAAALNFDLSPGDPLAQLQQFLTGKHLLLILDNMEQIADTATPIAGLLHGAPQLSVLATSQERLHVRGEWLLPVKSLTATDEGRATAVQLFVERATQLAPAFELTDEARDDIGRICDLVDGSALGIEIAASWTQLFPPHEIARRIAENVDFLVTTLRNVPERHRSLRAIFSYSLELLPAELRPLPAKLGVFRGDFTEQAALAVANVGLLELMQLVNRSLLRRTATGRFILPPVLRHFVEREISAETHTQHTAWFTRFLLEHAADLYNARQKSAVNMLLGDIENIRAAWQQTRASGNLEQQHEIAAALFAFYERLNWFDEGLDALQGDDPAFQAWRGALLVRRADYAAGQPLLTAALENGSSTATVAFASYYLGMAAEATARDGGGYDSAETHQQTALALYRELGNEWGMSNALNALGNIARVQQQFENALNFYRDSLRLSEKLGDRRGIAASYHNLGYAQEALEDFDAAQALYHKSITIKRELNDRRGLAFSLNNLGFLRYRLREHAAAQQALEESRTLFRELGYRRGEGYALINLGHIARATANPLLARRRYTAAHDILHALGDQRGAAFATEALTTLD